MKKLAEETKIDKIEKILLKNSPITDYRKVAEEIVKTIED